MLYDTRYTGKLRDIYGCLGTEESLALDAHFSQGTPASTIADILTKHGYPISATTIKEQRRKNKIGK